MPLPGNLRGIARPTRRLKAQLEVLHGKHFVERMDRVVEDVITIDALAKVLDQAMEKSVTKDGRMDLRDVAAYVLAEMKRMQR